MRKFQFLLGRLETWYPPGKILYCNVFQFLLGRLETFAASRTLFIPLAFQFLLGRLETIPFGLFLGQLEN